MTTATRAPRLNTDPRPFMSARVPDLTRDDTGAWILPVADIVEVLVWRKGFTVAFVARDGRADVWHLCRPATLVRGGRTYPDTEWVTVSPYRYTRTAHGATMADTDPDAGRRRRSYAEAWDLSPRPPARETEDERATV